MRVLIVTSTLAVGGAERLTVAYAEGLVRRGHEVHIAYGFRSNWEEQLDAAGVGRTNLVPEMLRPRRVPAATSALRRVVASFRPHVVFAQSVTTAAMARAVAPRTPVVVMLHGLPAAKERDAARVLRAVGASVVAVSDATAAQIARQPEALHVRVVRTGIDLEALRAQSLEPVPEALPAGRPRFVYVGRLAPEKRVPDLVRAFAIAAEELPEATLLVVGAGAELGRVQALTAELGLLDRVTFVGFQTNVERYVAASDVMTLCSEREGLPVALLEAFALGRPAVATDVGSVATLVQDARTGWLVPPRDVAALGRALVAAGSDPAEAARRGAAGRALVESEYSSQAMLDQLEDVLGEATSPLRLRSAPYYAAKSTYRRWRTARFRHGRRGDEPRWQGVRILAYHRVADDPDPLAVGVAQFRDHLDLLLEHGIRTVPLAEAVDLLAGPTLEDRLLCITFDDGYRDNLEVAAPLLSERGLPATVFVPSGLFDGRARFYWYRSPPPAMTLEEVRRLVAETRVDVQPHTRTHPALPTLDAAAARREIAESKTELETLLGRPMTTFSYPAGLHGPREVELVRSAGYRAAVTTVAGVNEAGAAPLTLRRTMVPHGTDRDAFHALLSGAFDEEPRVVEALRARAGRAPRR